MSVQMILLPLFVQVLLTITLGLMLAVRRRKALISRETRWQDISLREPNWPKDAIAVGNAWLNQFEVPVLFYVLTILALITKQADLLFVVMAWIFVADAPAAGRRLRHLQSRADPRRLFRHRRDRAVADVDHLYRPHPDACRGKATRMIPAARISAAIEVLSDIEDRRRPATDALKDWGLSHRFAGSSDRAAIAGLVYDALRRKASSALCDGRGGRRARPCSACCGWNAISMSMRSQPCSAARVLRRRR